MVHIIIATHGSFADGLMSSIELIAGQQDGITTINFVKEMSTEDLREEFLRVIEETGVREYLIMTDLAGGSPYNVSALLSTERKDIEIRVISGVNLPMMLEIVFSRDSMEMDGLLENAKKVGIAGITHFEIREPQVTAVEEEGI